ncbi:MAG: hypothetical protein WCT33_03925 [Patescibacteria group bacterium]
MMTEHPNIANEDWRLQAISTLAKEFKSPWTGKIFPIGTAVELVSDLHYSNKILSIPVPNMVSLFLDFSYNLWEDSQNIIESERFTVEKEDRLSVEDKNNLFNFLEKRMGSIVFSYTALESFANEIIPENYKIPGTNLKSIPNSLKSDFLDKNIAERNVNLGEKLDIILPNVLKIDSPKGTKVWQDYKTIKVLRDRIIHLKSIDRKSSRVEDETIWKELIVPDQKNIAVISKDIIEYYYQKSEKPRWLEKWPY